MNMRSFEQAAPQPPSANAGPRSPAAALLATLCWALAMTVFLSPAMGRWSQAWLPLLQLQLATMDDHYRTANLAIDLLHGEPKILWTVQQARSIVVGDKVAMPHPQGVAQASTLLINLWGPCGLVWACLLGHARLRQLMGIEGLRRLAMAMLATLTLLCLDVPMVLWAAIWSLHASTMAPDDFSPLLWWANFLDGGGRWALACAFGLAISSRAVLSASPAASRV
jgi:hypothetical protein